ncbi:eukaryotic translation initiation factor eIF-4A subunit [Microthyrium microscopicum]|uniref:Eukaryotic translation initiation factor eIF-4A subunit n=1 Tax=Microthyrium microscopicum TaxID=703497 RepID=A0A6A6U948_9PEZI|nr:eukaryotic translation initiation factor eIF-4A subunit [Microthyrium microscopicum]
MTQKILLHGATGETGGDILDGLIEDGSFEITALIRPQSLQKPATKALEPRGVKIVVGDLEKQSVKEIAELLAGYDTVISAVAATAQLDQLKLVDAAAQAGVKRFVPCGFTTVSPPGGVMTLIRAQKEKVHERIWYHHLPYTIIDSGYWYQISFPRLPSGKVDYALMGDKNTIFGDGNAPNMLVDKRDIGKFTARIIKDSRTLNKRVFLHADVLTQNEIITIMEEKSGEKVETKTETHDDLVAKMHAAREAHKIDPSNIMNNVAVYGSEYDVSKYVRKDNTPEIAVYLGYLDTKELYPDFKPNTFSRFVDELLAGQAKLMYQNSDMFKNLGK